MPMETEAASRLESIAPILVILGYAAVFHFLYWARDRYGWTRKTVDWLGRVSRHGESVVLIWALIADLLAVVFILIWLTSLR
jgi:hypothetical protein